LTLASLTDRVTRNGRTATSVYTATTRTLTTTSAAGRQSTVVIDAQGRMTKAQRAGLLAINTSYDGCGRPSSLTQGSGADDRTLTLSYNNDGFLQTVTDPLNRAVSYAYDAAGRITQQTLPEGRVVLYDYDANGNLIALTPPGRPAHLFAYTPVDQREQYTPPDVGIGNPRTVYSYNADKQLTQISQPDGQTASFGYDSAGRLSAVNIPDEQLGYSYNATGQLAGITAPDGGALAYGYSGALLAQTAWTGTVAGTVGFTYDNDFRLASVSVNGSNSVAYQYDPDSLLTQAGDLTLSRNAQNGLLAGTTLGGVADTRSYNGFGEVMDYSATYNGSALLAITYARDLLGRITSKTETLLGGASTIYGYRYDPAGRLTEVTRDGATVAAYSYDANGNRLSGPGLTAAPTYDDQDRLLQYGAATYSYTANGELQS
jgi:YD repeat-containing protein